MSVILIGGIIAAVGTSIVVFGTYLKNKQEEESKELKEKIEARQGEIKDVAKISYPIVEIGNSGAKYECPEGIFITMTGNSFKFYVKNNVLFVSTLLRDKDGKIIASVHDNIWEVIEDGYDYNNDNSAIEIITAGDRRILFQLELRDGIAHFIGMINNVKGEGMYFSEHESGKGSIMTFMNKELGFDFPIYKKFLFKYPRKMFFGKRATL